MKFRKIKDKNSGGIIIIVMIVIGSMTAVSLSLANSTRLSMKINRISSDRLSLYYAALSGIEKTKSIFTQQPITPLRIKEICVSAKQNYELPGNSGNIKVEVKILDEFSMLNFDRIQPPILEEIGFDPEIAMFTSDWVDPDNFPNMPGAETDHYMQQDKPYRAKNAAIEHYRELLYIKKINMDTYKEIVRVFTIYGDGKVNLNTASVRTLSNMPGISKSVGLAIYDYLNSNSQNHFASTQDLGKIKELSPTDIELLGQYCKFTSDHFRIFSRASLDDSDIEIMAVLKMTDDGIKTISIERLR